MKLGTTIAGLALIGAAAAATNPALADSKEPPHALTAPKSSFMGNSQGAKPRNFSFEAKSGTSANVMPPPPATSDSKK